MRERLISALEETFGDRISVKGANAGLHFVTEFDCARSEKEILARADAEQLDLFAMSRFRLKTGGDSNKPQLILGFARLKESDIQEGVYRLYRQFSAHKKTPGIRGLIYQRSGSVCKIASSRPGNAACKSSLRRE